MGTKVRPLPSTYHDLGTLGQRGAELGQLLVDLLKILNGLAALAAGNVHDVEQQAAALDMAQEVVAKAHALAGTLNKARNIGADEACPLAHRHDA